MGVQAPETHGPQNPGVECKPLLNSRAAKAAKPTILNASPVV